MVRTCDPFERFKQEYLEFQAGLDSNKQKVKLQTWRDYICNPSIQPFWRLKHKMMSFKVNVGFKEKKDALSSSGLLILRKYIQA